MWGQNRKVFFVPLTLDLNWTYIWRSEKGIFWTSCVRSIYVLCPGCTLFPHIWKEYGVVAIFDNSQLTGSKSINWFLYAPQAIPYLLQIYRKIRTGILPSLICHGLSHGGLSAHTRKKKHVSKNIFSFLRVSTNYHSFVHASWNLFFFSSFWKLIEYATNKTLPWSDEDINKNNFCSWE